MELHNYEPGLFIEELVFQMEPARVAQYAQLEYDIMAQDLAKLDGFAGWQIWESETNKGEVTSLYLWTSEAHYKRIDQKWLFAKKDEITEAFGADNMSFVKAGHETNRRRQLKSLH